MYSKSTKKIEYKATKVSKDFTFERLSHITACEKDEIFRIFRLFLWFLKKCFNFAEKKILSL